MARGSNCRLLRFWRRGREKETLARCQRMARGSNCRLLRFWRRGREKETLARCLRELEGELESETEVTEGFTKHSLGKSEAILESKEPDSSEDNRVYEISEVKSQK
ncbi:hypothetical protein CRG98_048341 [Punica granatum]|uniref:Uncharacterized protein n=1 Tax=Punica granatum TaxID=22663 RepID=A0A2I0HHV2_PUNGR|nr:hypothetical protein CRG98_048341 [Punica granatum]